VTDTHDVVAVEVLGDYKLRLTFDDGTVGDLDLHDLERRSGVFAALSDPFFFAQVRVDPELGTVVWPNGADLDPCGLYNDIVARRADRAS
jgi:hypothetical protein